MQPRALIYYTLVNKRHTFCKCLRNYITNKIFTFSEVDKAKKKS